MVSGIQKDSAPSAPRGCTEVTVELDGILLDAAGNPRANETIPTDVTVAYDSGETATTNPFETVRRGSPAASSRSTGLPQGSMRRSLPSGRRR